MYCFLVNNTTKNVKYNFACFSHHWMWVEPLLTLQICFHMLHGVMDQSSGEGDKSEGSYRDQIQEEANDVETEQVENIDGVMNGDKNLPKEADYDNGIQWGRRAIKQFLMVLGIILP